MAAASDVQAWARLVATVADEVVLGTTYTLHRTITDGGFRWVGPPARPIKRVHDHVVDRTYRVVGGAIRAAGAGVAHAVPHVWRGGPSRGSTKARAIAHGVLDHRFLEVAPEFEQDVELRHVGQVVAADPESILAAYPAASDRLVVFVHGLVDTEAVWTPDTPEGATLPTIAAGTGATPVFVRYGTGRAISENGAQLAELLDTVVASWPVPVEGIVLVGHSMGGLVARAATTLAEAHGQAWVQAVSDVVYLGTPHLGSWLEKVAAASATTMQLTSRHAAPFGALLDGRSQGIKDLWAGSLAAAGEPRIGEADAKPSTEPSWLVHATHHLVVGRLRPAARHPLNLLLGDGLVRSGSAQGRGRRRDLGPGRTRVVEVAAQHSDLPHHPEVADLVARIVERA